MPTEPAPPPPAFQHLAGIWKGFLTITDGGWTVPFTLRIAGDPQGYTGQFELASVYPGTFNVGVAGSARDDGYALLTGLTAVGTSNVTITEVHELLVRTDEAAGLAGTIRFGRRVGAHSELFNAQILSASLQPTSEYPGGLIEGHWLGQAIVTACSGSCTALTRAGSTHRIELVLRQSGSTLSGSGDFDSNGCGSQGCWLPLAGSADGHSINSLTGHFKNDLRPGGAGESVMTLSDFSATVDDLGRMHARFVYTTEGKQWLPPTPLVLSNAKSRLTMESVWLTREP